MNYKGLVAFVLTVLFGLSILSIPVISKSDRGTKKPSEIYRPLLKETLKDTFGHDRYLSLSAAQVMQESAWNCLAYSRFAGGCAQFTPSTAKWAAKSFCRGLGKADVEDPNWALPCMVRYDWWLYQRIKAKDTCEHMAMVLSSYNGGLGNLYKDKKLTQAKGKNPKKWWQHVEHYSNRAKWAFKENRDYPVRIMGKWQKYYISQGYGGVKICDL